uniref:Uncharacterized protein n=1 Tax=Clastoptera arizonana TaxID=38151 RepID=A0A1B6CVN9_9HEMI
MITSDPFNIFVGGLSGVFKGVTANLSKGIHNIKNLENLKDIVARNEVTFLNWGNKEETEILIGYADQTIKIYDLESRQFTFKKKLISGKGEIRGVFKYNGNLTTAVESGIISSWSEEVKRKEGEITFKIDTGGSLCVMRSSPENINLIATGGKENDLKLWDLETQKQTFNAKNVRPDELQLRVPVWVSDLVFMPNSEQVAVSTRYGHVRLYDPTTSTRRPVIQVTVPDQALTCISTAPKDKHVLVGSGTGHMFLVDLRKGILLNHFKGFVGGIRQIACPKTEPYVLSVALDRHLRIHNLNTKQLIYKEYLQSRLSTLLIKSDFSLIKKEIDDEYELSVKKKDINCESDEEYDALFENMEVISEKETKTKNNKVTTKEGKIKRLKTR